MTKYASTMSAPSVTHSNPKITPLNTDDHTQCMKADCKTLLTKAVRMSKSQMKYKVILMNYSSKFVNNMLPSAY